MLVLSALVVLLAVFRSVSVASFLQKEVYSLQKEEVTAWAVIGCS